MLSKEDAVVKKKTTMHDASEEIMNQTESGLEA